MKRICRWLSVAGTTVGAVLLLPAVPAWAEPVPDVPEVLFTGSVFCNDDGGPNTFSVEWTIANVDETDATLTDIEPTGVGAGHAVTGDLQEGFLLRRNGDPGDIVSGFQTLPGDTVGELGLTVLVTPLITSLPARTISATVTLDGTCSGGPIATPTSAAPKLPVTGSSVGGLAAAGTILLVLGAVLIALLRRTRGRSSPTSA
jgi:hypothetical protein